MLRASEHQLSKRIVMLQGVYEDNLHLGKLQRRRPSPPHPPARQRHWLSWALLGITLMFGPALGYLGPTVLVQSQKLEISDTQRKADTHSFVASADNSVQAPVYSPLLPSAPELAVMDDHLQFARVESVKASDFDLLLRDDLPPLTEVFGLDVKTIVIDPGHGGADPGAIGSHGTMEKDIALDVALRLRDRLNRLGHYNILMTRDTDSTLRLNERVEFANTSQADLFLSIHVNAFPDVRVKTIETYYFGAPSDTATIELAKLENTDSHYRMAEFKSMITKLSHTMKHQESATLATSIQHNLFQNIHRLDHRVRDFGVKTAPFVVLLGVDAPSVLAEISCISNVDEEIKLTTPAYRDKIASFLEKGIHEYLRHKQSRTAGDSTNEWQNNG